MKWTGGPVVARARIAGFRQFEHCTPEQLRSATAGFALHNLSAYWASRPARFDALAIYLEQETWLDEPMTVVGRSYGSSWIVLPDRTATARWMTVAREVTRAPRDSRGTRTAGAALRFAVFRRDSFTCQYCGRRGPDVPLHVDHVVPWSRGGATVLANLRTACSECNLGKSDRDV
jgi:5-methylcytosine-specific restriction endonuclease McrA